MSGLFISSQLHWAVLIKDAYAIYISVNKLSFYLDDSDITLRSNHLPFRTFLARNTLTLKVYNWAVGSEQYQIKFEYIKDFRNMLADTMRRLVDLDPHIC